MIVRILRHLHPGRASQQPALFLLAVVAAFLSVLALHDGILQRPTVALETLSAIISWSAWLAVTCVFAILDRDRLELKGIGHTGNPSDRRGRRARSL